MSHFGAIAWVDFARGLLPAGERILMERHLSEGCVDCVSELAFFAKVALAGVGVAEAVAPEDIVQTARNIFPPREKQKPLLERLVARLVYDSFADLAPAGVRSGRAMSRQLMYEVEDYLVDLRLEGERDSTLVSVVGQIANRNLPASPMVDRSIRIVSGKSVVCKTLSNGFGEFCLDYTPKKNMKLLIAISEGERLVEVSLNRLIEEHPAT
jgi:hypothetical protein